MKKSFRSNGISLDKIIIPIDSENKFDLSVFISENLKYDIFVLSPLYEKFVYQYAIDNPDKIFVPLETIKNYSYTNIIPVLLNCSKAYSDLGTLFAKYHGMQIDKITENKIKQTTSTNNSNEIELEPVITEPEKITINVGAVIFNLSKRREDDWTSFKQAFENGKNPNSKELFVYEIFDSSEPNIEYTIKDAFVNNECNLILLYGASFNSRILESLNQDNMFLFTELWSKKLTENYNKNIYYTIEYDYKKSFDELSKLIEEKTEGFKEIFLEGNIKKIKKHSTLYNLLSDK